MRYVLGVILVGGLLATIAFMIFAPVQKDTGPGSQPNPVPAPSEVPPLSTAAPPDTIVFDNTYGQSVFTHKLHYERVNGKCDTCHPQIFPQSREPINYKKALHRSAEASATACAACHRVGGTSFAADSNCVKCHAVKQ
jgi:c(7)-type cytochrome triheme protein